MPHGAIKQVAIRFRWRELVVVSECQGNPFLIRLDLKLLLYPGKFLRQVLGSNVKLVAACIKGRQLFYIIDEPFQHFRFPVCLFKDPLKVRVIDTGYFIGNPLEYCPNPHKRFPEILRNEGKEVPPPIEGFPEIFSLGTGLIDEDTVVYDLSKMVAKHGEQVQLLFGEGVGVCRHNPHRTQNLFFGGDRKKSHRDDPTHIQGLHKGIRHAVGVLNHHGLPGHENFTEDGVLDVHQLQLSGKMFPALPSHLDIDQPVVIGRIDKTAIKTHDADDPPQKVSPQLFRLETYLHVLRYGVYSGEYPVPGTEGLLALFKLDKGKYKEKGGWYKDLDKLFEGLYQRLITEPLQKIGNSV